MPIISDLKSYQSRLTQLGVKDLDVKKETTIQKYKDLIKIYLYENSQGGFIQDPSQNNQIVSEGQSYWMILSSDMARLDPKNANLYQRNFDSILNGTKSMIQLSKDARNAGEFSAWKVKKDDTGKVVLDKDKFGFTCNSAADADLDLIRALTYAQDLAKQGVWVDKGYSDLAKKLIVHAKDNLFKNVKDVLVMKPSEDWDSFNFSDYLAPATCAEIASFAKEYGMDSSVYDFYNKAATDSMVLYKEILADVGEFPSHVKFLIKDKNNITVTRVNNTAQSYDGIRSPWEIGRYIISANEDLSEEKTAVQSLMAGEKKGYNFTAQTQMDNAMYLPLAVGVGDSKSIDKISRNIASGSMPSNKYFENTLYLLGVIDSYFPRKINIVNK